MDDTQNEDQTQDDGTSTDEQLQMRRLDPKEELRLLKQRADMLGITYGPNTGVELLKSRIAEKTADPAEAKAEAEAPALASPPVVETAEPQAIQAPAEQAASPDTPAMTAEDMNNPVFKFMMEQMRTMQAQMTTMAQNQNANPFPRDTNSGVRVGGAHRLKGGGMVIPREVREAIIAEQMKLIRIRVTCMNPQKKDLQGEILTVGNEAIGTVRKFVPYGDASENGWHVPYCIYQLMVDKQFPNIRSKRDPRTGTQVVETGMVREYAIEVLPPLTEEELKELARQQAAADSIDRGESMS